MTEKTTYWIGKGDEKALVTGTDEQARWTKLQGWTDAAEPGYHDRVWLQHEVTGGRAAYPQPSIEEWAKLGWHPGPPPEPVDLTKDPAYVDQPAQAEPVPAAKNKAVADGETKEKLTHG